MALTASFRKRLDAARLVLIDTSVVIYQLEDLQPWSELTDEIFRRLAVGMMTGLMSTVTVTEVLAKPFESDDPEVVGTCERFLLSVPGVSIIPPDYAIARRAAVLRARHRLRTPDSLLLATAIELGADAFLTNDVRLGSLRTKEIAFVVLDRFVKG